MIQLVAVGTTEPPTIEYRDNADGRPLRSFNTDDERPLLWSSSDLVHIALSLRGQGFRVSGALVTDAGRRPIDNDAQTEIVRLLNKADERAANAYLASEKVDGFLQAITISNSAAHSWFRLLQNGRVESRDSADAEALVSALSAS
ncbi:hypothetical protein [Clavibacter zhangzhiyongii]|uniref:hypothetical protein n=1 Tax=Clavibacter zhangzhiyongii TaxID=2768071 RepID=UPI0039DFA541